MKLKNIFGVFLVLLAISSCTEEEAIDSPEDGKAQLSVVFSTDDMKTTKAVADGFTYATEEEVAIDDYHVAIFDANTDARINFANGNNNGGKSFTQTFKISNIEHPSVYALVIVNTGETDVYSAFTTYSDYEAHTIGTPVNLTKVGKSTNTTLQSGTSNTIPVSLNQLTARIQFKGVNVETRSATTKAETETTSYNINKESDLSDSILEKVKIAISKNQKINQFNVEWKPKQGQENNGTYREPGLWIGKHYTNWEKSLLSGGYYNSSYTDYEWNSKNKAYYRSAQYNNRVLLVSKTVTTTTDGSTTPGSEASFIVDNVRYKGINTQSKVTIFNTDANNEVEINESDRNITTEFESLNRSSDGSSFKPFYTYEGAKLVFEVTGTYTPATSGSSVPGTTNTTVHYGYIIQERPTGGWKGDIDNPNLETMDAAGEIVWVTEETKAAPVSKSANAVSKTYTLDLSNQKIIKGNIYNVTGNMTPSGLILNVSVAPWETKEIEVGFGK